MSLRPENLDEVIPEDHLARTLWELIGGLDLSAFLAPIKAREGEPGRDATDPRLLVTLWCYATSQGVGSARQLDKLCVSHDAYRWICGGVSLNHHTLSDFKTDHGEALKALMIEVIARTLNAGLASMECTAQDGMRVRASAGAASFRREPSLDKCLEQAREQVEYAQKYADDPELSAAQKAARKRAAREYQERIEQAKQELAKVREVKKSAEKKEQARASTTDPEARTMKMPDGGFRPAYNVQFATTTEGGIIVGVDVSNSGSDGNLMTPMLEQIEKNTGQRPEKHLADGGFESHEAIEKAADKGIEAYVPPRKKRGVKDGPPCYEPQPGDSEAIKEWRGRMASEEGKEIYKERAQTAELVNAQVREHQGLKLRVRGLKKVLAVVLWHALAYNLTRWIALTS